MRVWIPHVEFILYGPLNQGSEIWLEAGVPGKKKWFSRGCEGRTRLGEFSDEYRDIEQATENRCSYSVRYLPEGAPTTYTGIVDFSLHMRDERRGTSDVALFTGKFKVAKQPGGTGLAGDVDYYVDEDWRLPIGFLTAGDAGGLRANLAFRKSVGRAVAYLFYRGKQLEEVSCGSGVDLSQDGKVDLRKCEFWSVSKKANPYRPTEEKHLLTQNPGEYEIKVMADGRLVRSAKFTVDAEGSFDNGIATAGRLGTLGVVVPVSVLGTSDGAWNKLAWKTDAFYGNPLTGFTAPQ
ncbi:MAG: hypothetical protein ACRDGM_05745 [bacterium]